MTVKEAAVIEIYTGICLLTGDKRKYAYEYASSLIGRPIFTHEFLTLKEELKKRSYKDLVEICQNLEECSDGETDSNAWRNDGSTESMHV